MSAVCFATVVEDTAIEQDRRKEIQAALKSFDWQGKVPTTAK